MARTELPNGVILPAEYSDDWYEDMTSNLTKLDDVIGSDSEKLNSNDVAFLRMSSAALTDGGTGNFSDLNSSNKLKTGDYVLDSGRKLYQIVSVNSTTETFTVGNSLFKVTAESDLAPVAESGDYDDLDNKPDLNPYDQHIVNTDIHVTTADKTKWNNGVSQAYVFRYSGTAVVPNSTIAYSTIDNTDNIKAGDKILDVDGKLFEITAVDTTNQTVTVGLALVDLALDANVVHTSGNETVGGEKTFTSSIKGYNSDSTQSTVSIDLRTSKVSRGNTSDGADTFGFGFRDKNNSALASISCVKRSTGGISEYHTVNTTDSSNNVLSESYSFNLSKDGNSTFRPETNDKTLLGTSTNNWKGVYATNYYYGANNVEFSNKFVTTDTNQTISGAKTFSDNLTIYNSDDTQTPKGLTIRNAQWGMGESGTTTVSNINFLDKNSSIPASVMASKGLYGQSFLRFGVRTKDSQNNIYSEEIYYDIDTSGNVEFRSWHDNAISLGTSAYRWKDVQTKLINGLTPSSLSLPVIDRTKYVDISGYFTNTGNGDINTYNVTANGWIYLRLTDIDSCQLSVLDSSNNRLYGSTSSGSLEQLCLPVTVGTVVETQWTTNTSVTVAIARFIPCQGNI